MTTFFATPKEITIKDTLIVVKPLAVKNIAKAAKCATPLINAFKDGVVNPMVLLENADSVIELVAIATGQTEDFIGELNTSELLQLSTMVVKENIDFFSQAIVPQIKAMMATVQEVAETVQKTA